jgi:predicted ABC-type ATPase
MLSEIQSFAKRRLPFAFETTLSGRSYMGLLQRLKAQGYEVHLFFLWVESVILHCRGSENESCEAGTMCQNR